MTYSHMASANRTINARKWAFLVGAMAVVALVATNIARQIGWYKTAPVLDIQLDPLTPPAGPQTVFHLGHSLVGVDMPAMLKQLAGSKHDYRSQLGWGTPLRAHWEPDVEINGFEAENAHSQYQDAKTALESGNFSILVATEMVEIRDAIKYHNSGHYLGQWAALAGRSNPDIRVYLYETWPEIASIDAWLERVHSDQDRHWKHDILFPAINQTEQPIYLIPAGEVFAQYANAVAKTGSDANAAIRALFSDDIHVNDLGAYLIALTHFAVIYQQNPVGLPYQLRKADGSQAQSPDPETALLMQQVVWDVVSQNTFTGIAPKADQ